jgi:hypothetical protein
MVMPTGKILLTLGEAIPCSDQEGVELDPRSFYGQLFHLMTNKIESEDERKAHAGINIPVETTPKNMLGKK